MTAWSSIAAMIEIAPRLHPARSRHFYPPPAVLGRDGLDRLGRNGRYDLIGLVNEGGQALIWAARDGADEDRLVIVKTVNPSSPDPATGARLSREARLLDLLAGSPRVMPLRDWGPGRARGEDHGPHESKHPWLALPYLPHITLPRVLARGLDRRGGAGIGADDAWTLATGLAQALQHLASRGVVHRDLSPGNVLLTADGVVVSDLGMAWAPTMDDAPLEHQFTTGLSAAGRGWTPGWLAPEAGRPPTAPGERPDRDPAADVFCWGLHLHLALTGRHPWSSTGPTLAEDERYWMYEHTQSPNLTDLDDPSRPRELTALVAAALDLTPENRPRPEELLARLGTVPPSAQRDREQLRARAEELAAARSESDRLRVQLISRPAEPVVPVPLSTPPHAAPGRAARHALAGVLAVLLIGVPTAWCALAVRDAGTRRQAIESVSSRTELFLAVADAHQRMGQELFPALSSSLGDKVGPATRKKLQTATDRALLRLGTLSATAPDRALVARLEGLVPTSEQMTSLRALPAGRQAVSVYLRRVTDLAAAVDASSDSVLRRPEDVPHAVLRDAQAVRTLAAATTAFVAEAVTVGQGVEDSHRAAEFVTSAGRQQASRKILFDQARSVLPASEVALLDQNADLIHRFDSFTQDMFDAATHFGLFNALPAALFTANNISALVARMAEDTAMVTRADLAAARAGAGTGWLRGWVSLACLVTLGAAALLWLLFRLWLQLPGRRDRALRSTPLPDLAMSGVRPTAQLVKAGQGSGSVEEPQERS